MGHAAREISKVTRKKAPTKTYTCQNCGHFYEANFAPEYLISLNLCLPKNKSPPWSRQFSEASICSLVKTLSALRRRRKRITRFTTYILVSMNFLQTRFFLTFERLTY
jgi:hypothetical protein